MNVPDGEGYLLPELLLVKLHPDNLVREPLVEQSVYLGSSAQLQRVHIPTAAALDRSLEVLLKSRHHLKHCLRLDRGVVWPGGVQLGIQGVC